MKKVFVVDDEKRLTGLMQEKLGPMGYEVHAHNAYPGAFEKAKQIKPNVAILDVMLGNGAGYQVSRQIRSDPLLYQTPILFISSLGEKREMEYAFQQGADSYLAKPFSLPELLDRLKRLEQLENSLQRRDALTNLGGIEWMEREVDHRLIRGQAFALCYLNIDEYHAYVARYGQEKGNEVICFLGQLVQQELKDLQEYEVGLSHMGGGHFFLLCPVEKYERICKHLTHRFAQEVVQFYSEHEAEQGYMVATRHKGTYTAYPLMSLRVCVAHTDHKDYPCAREMLHKLRAMHGHTRKEDKHLVFTYKQGKKW